MRIQITDKIILTSDSQNFILNTEVKTKKGEIELRPFAYYSSVLGAIEGCLKHKMRESTATTLKTLITEHRVFVKHCRELMGGMK